MVFDGEMGTTWVKRGKMGIATGEPDYIEHSRETEIASINIGGSLYLNVY